MLQHAVTDLKKRLIEYAALVEDMIQKSTKGLLTNNRLMLEEVRDVDEPLANRMELELEEKCTSLIAKYQPLANDLRAVMMIAQMNNDLERLGDLAVNIVESSLELIDQPMVKPLIDIPKMSEIAIGMVRDSIDSFIKSDSSKAQAVCERDAEVDQLKEQINRELLTHMMSDPNIINRAFQLIRISNSLERIADLSTNICEDAIYIIEGKVIKHHKQEDDTP